MDIDLYIDFVYHGFYKLEDIESRFEDYRSAALEAASQLSEDEVILFAIYGFDELTQRLLYANFMKRKLSAEEYRKVCEKLSRSCRLFCVWNS